MEVNGTTWDAVESKYHPSILCKDSQSWEPMCQWSPVKLLMEKSRVLCPGGRFPPSFIHQVVIITGLNKLYDYVLALKMGLDADRA